MDGYLKAGALGVNKKPFTPEQIKAYNAMRTDIARECFAQLLPDAVSKPIPEALDRAAVTAFQAADVFLKHMNEQFSK